MATDLQEKLNALKIDRAEAPERPRGLVVKIAIAGAAVAAIAFATWYGLRARPVPVRTAVVQEIAASAGGASAVLNASGYVTARRQATVSSKVTGKVVEVLVEEGMVVREGQILARLDDSILRRERSLAEARPGAQRRPAHATRVPAHAAGVH